MILGSGIEYVMEEMTKAKGRIRYFDELCERVLSVCQREGVCVCVV